jgi:hypothetical protein
MKVFKLFIVVFLLIYNSHARIVLQLKNSYTIETSNEITETAWVQSRGEWIKGFVILNNGVVTSCQFPTLGPYGGVTLIARIYNPIYPTKLNPNNQFAITNNFTHYIDIPNYGRAYFILNEQPNTRYSNDNLNQNQNFQSEKVLRAYVQIQNQWIEGSVVITNGQVTRCQFPNMIEIIGRDISAQIYYPSTPIRLNPNHQLAISNNFTHYVDIPNYGRAFFTYN